MKLFLLFSVFCIYFLTIANGAAVDTVVEQEKDTVRDAETKVILDSIDQDCHQPREVGRCFALLYRYAFNAESLKCEEFIYGGCEGNNNNFKSLEECERKCLKKEDEEEHTKSPEDEDKKDEEDGINKETKIEGITETIPIDKSTQ